jgi:hypothetical protein
MIGLLISALATVGAIQADTADPSYFPPSLANPSITCLDARDGEAKPTISNSKKLWYSQDLSVAGEPPLYHAADRGTVRFTWLRTFDAPIIVRVKGLETSSPQLIAKRLTGKGGYAPGPVEATLKRRLTPVEAASIRTTLARTRIFSAPTSSCRMGTDGAEWLIEGNDRAGYHAVSDWSPDKGAVRETGLALLKLTGWNIDPIY